MSPTIERLFGYWHAFDDPVTTGASIAIAAVLVTAPLAVCLLYRRNRLSPALYHEIMLRWRSWLWLVLFMLGPILLGGAWVMAAVALLGLFCYREYARATGLSREGTINAVAVAGILAVTFAVVDHFDRLFFAVAPLTVGAIAVVTIPEDRPSGYVHRVALGVLGLLFFGYSFGYVGFIANDAQYRPLLILLLLSVELNDIFAFCVGKPVGGPKLLPRTSPNKTIAGSAGALVLTTALVMGLGHVVFANTPMDRLGLLLLLGVVISVLGQLGDLLVSSVKRDVGIKDMGRTIPGHGGVLDRFNSLVLVPPAFFHYLSLVLGPLGSGPEGRILTGG